MGSLFGSKPEELERNERNEMVSMNLQLSGCRVSVGDGDRKIEVTGE